MTEVQPDVALPAGVYQHWKGPLYLVLGLAHDANAGELYSNKNYIARSSERHPLGEREVVVYVGLQLDAAHEGARLAVRTLDDFFAKVCLSKEHQHYGQSGDHVVEGPCAVMPRFSYLGPRFADGMQMRRGLL